MSLPFRVGSASDSRVVSVDGAWGAPGLNLSHWPGNATPAGLEHPLATGIALNFARLSREAREELSAGCVAVSNNHLDTDGVCSVWTVQNPERALELEQQLLAAATCGDFFRVRSEDALSFDAVVSSLLGSAPFEGLSEERATALGYELMLPLVEDFALGRFEREFAEVSRAARARFAEQRNLARAALASEDSVLRLATFAAGPIDRHALFSSTPLESALCLTGAPSGLRAWLVLNTEWFFEYQPHELGAKPDLARLALRLNELEGAHPGAAHSWRAIAPTGATPQLYFGRAGQEQFDENNVQLESSSLTRESFLEELGACFRAAQGLPA